MLSRVLTSQPYMVVTYPTKLMLCEVLTDAGRVWYTRAHVPIYAKGVFNYS